jgi:Mn-dependent DtxR family transcriptional regulator
MAFSRRRKEARMYQIMQLLDRHYALSKKQLARKMALKPRTVQSFLHEMKEREIIAVKYVVQRAHKRETFYSTMRAL